MKKIEQDAIEIIDKIILSLQADKVIIKKLGLEKFGEAHGACLRYDVEDYIALMDKMREV